MEEMILPITTPDMDYRTYAAVHPNETLEAGRRIDAAVRELSATTMARPLSDIMMEVGYGGDRAGSEGITAMMEAVAIYGLRARVKTKP